MRVLILFFLNIFFVAPIFSQLEWAQIGAKWTYVRLQGISYVTVPQYESIGEEMFAGKLCRVVKGPFTNFPLLYTYEENGQIFIYNEEDSSFQMRFDYNLEVGESWQYLGDYGMVTATVDSVITREYSGQSFQVQYVTITDPEVLYSHKVDRVIIGIGSRIKFTFPFPINITVDDFSWLPCFYSEATGSLEIEQPSFIKIDCDSLNTSTKDFGSLVTDMQIYPNPITETATLKYTLTNPENISIQLYDINGRILRSFLENEKRNVGQQEETLAWPTDTPSGNYVVVISSGSGQLGIKVVK